MCKGITIAVGAGDGITAGAEAVEEIDCKSCLHLPYSARTGRKKHWAVARGGCLFTDGKISMRSNIPAHGMVS